MIKDLPTIINAIENCVAIPTCRDCSWDTCECEHEVRELPLDLIQAALAVVKEQNAKSPVKPIVGHNIGPTWWYACSYCRTAIDSGDNYCRNCGRAVKWE